VQPFTNHPAADRVNGNGNGLAPPPPGPRHVRDADGVGARTPPENDHVQTPRLLERIDSEVDLALCTPVLARRRLSLWTERAFHVTDVTDECCDLIEVSGVQEGVLTVHSEHTTCAVKINERETCFLEDLRLFMEKLVPHSDDAYYFHDDFEIRDPHTLAGRPEDEPINGHSHIKQMLLGCASESVPVADGRLALGQWQRIMFIELDQARLRHINIQVQGWR
jgi:secondary thiamine-phosphate synthase enzyme